MADKLDRALNLLRARTWAGPSTNPVLEKRFMQGTYTRPQLNLRLVLGIAGALVGLGAVAAAARPSWRSAVMEFIAPASAKFAVAPPQTPPASKPASRPSPKPTLAAIGPATTGTPTFEYRTAPSAQPAPAMLAGIQRGDLPITAEQAATLDFDSSPVCTHADMFSSYVRGYMTGDKGARERLLSMARGEELPKTDDLALQLATKLQYMAFVEAAARVADPSVEIAADRVYTYELKLEGGEPFTGVILGEGDVEWLGQDLAVNGMEGVWTIRADGHAQGLEAVRGIRLQIVPQVVPAAPK
jgi:hypothetical protein